MKKSHIILLLLVIASIGIVFYSLQNSETYANFTEAEANPEKIYHVVGHLNREKEMSYNPYMDANVFTFYLKDQQGIERKVLLHKSKPQDFDKSEQIVVIGKANNGIFEAKDILTKCPSKYADVPTQEVK